MKRILNFFRDRIIEYLLIALALAGVFYLALTHGSFAEPNSRVRTAYVDKIFNRSYVHKIEIEIDPRNLADLNENPREKTKYHTTVTIDGEKLDDVAFSTRGNGSLVKISDSGETDRYSYTLNFRKFNNNNAYYGLDKLVLNSLYSDPSYLRNYLALILAEKSGVDTPLTSFTELYFNGELRGLYLAVESVDQAFLNRTGAEPTAALFHPIPYNINCDWIYQEGKTLTEDDVKPWEVEVGYNGSDFKYLGDSPESYNAIFENAVTKHSKQDEDFIVRAIRSLEPYEANLNPEDFWDIDSVIDFFVAAALAPDADSYLGATSQNYFLELSHGKLSLIPWDHDLAFHVIGPDDTPSDDDASVDATTDFASIVDDSAPTEDKALFTDDAILWPIDTPLVGLAESDRPLWRLIAENPTYLERYHARLQTVLNNYLFAGARQDFDAAIELIRDYVYADPTSFYTVDDFETEVEYLSRFLVLRAESIQKQLWGFIPRARGVEPSSTTSPSSVTPASEK